MNAVAPSLFLFHTDCNVGYAIEPAEALFYEVGLEIAGGDRHASTSASEILREDTVAVCQVALRT